MTTPTLKSKICSWTNSSSMELSMRKIIDHKLLVRMWGKLSSHLETLLKENGNNSVLSQCPIALKRSSSTQRRKSESEAIFLKRLTSTSSKIRFRFLSQFKGILKWLKMSQICLTFKLRSKRLKITSWINKMTHFVKIQILWPKTKGKRSSTRSKLR